MKIYVYADESGTFDQANNNLFVYGGIIVPGKEVKDDIERRYIAVERDVRRSSKVLGADDEAKANALTMRERKRLYQTIEASPCCQFGVIVDQSRLRPNVFATKGSKQRYLDWALKMGLKAGILSMVGNGTAPKEKISKIAVFVDEHSSSTSGKYNLHDSINEEFRHGMYGSQGMFHDPVFSPEFPEIPVNYLDSSKVTLIRAADITANWIYCAERDCAEYPFAMDRICGNAVLYRHP